LNVKQRKAKTLKSKIMKTTIVTISINYHNAKEICESIEQKTFDSFTDLRKELDSVLELDEGEEHEEPQFLSLEDFVYQYNHQDLFYETTFISYVNVKD